MRRTLHQETRKIYTSYKSNSLQGIWACIQHTPALLTEEEDFGTVPLSATLVKAIVDELSVNNDRLRASWSEDELLDDALSRIDHTERYLYDPSDLDVLRAEINQLKNTPWIYALANPENPYPEMENAPTQH